MQQNIEPVAELTSDKKIFRIQLLAVSVGILLLIAKFAAYYLTHSNTILTDALESIINVVAGAFALYSLYLSSKPKDYDHPYGHGKVEFISAGFEGIMIAIAGVLIIGKSALPHCSVASVIIFWARSVSKNVFSVLLLKH